MFTKKRKENYPVNIRRIVTEIIAIIHSKKIFLFIKRRLILHYYLVIIIMFIIYLLGSNRVTNYRNKTYYSNRSHLSRWRKRL